MVTEPLYMVLLDFSYFYIFITTHGNYDTYVKKSFHIQREILKNVFKSYKKEMKNKLLQPRKRNVLHFNHSKKTSKINNKK